MPQRFHLFISHFQAEASGDVGTLHHFFRPWVFTCGETLTLKGEITESAMREGVRASDAFVLF